VSEEKGRSSATVKFSQGKGKKGRKAQERHASTYRLLRGGKRGEEKVVSGLGRGEGKRGGEIRKREEKRGGEDLATINMTLGKIMTESEKCSHHK